MKKVYIGIDVSKDALEADMLDGTTRSFGNSESGHRSLAAALRRLGGEAAVAVYEPTGGYERRMARSLSASGIETCMASALKVRQFARSQGMLAKTDRLDARAITAFAQASRLRPREPCGERSEAIRELLRRRERLVEAVKAESCRLAQQGSDLCRRQSRSLIRILRSQIASLEKEALALIGSDEQLASKARRLEAVKGIGWLTAATVLAEVPQLGTLSSKQVAALVGLAPFARDSGKSYGARHIRGGNFLARKCLFMPAQCAKRHNAHLKAFYDRLRSKGKPFKVAITAVMRKMIVLMNRIIADPTFEPS